MKNSMQRENFNIFNGFIDYSDYENGIDRVFIARCRNKADAGPFITFLKNNFTLNEYLELTKETTPLEALQTKGYVSPRMRKFMKTQS